MFNFLVFLPLFLRFQKHVFSWDAGIMSNTWFFSQLSLICIMYITFHIGAFSDWGTLKPKCQWYCCKRCETSHECMGSEWPVCDKCRLAQDLKIRGSASLHCNRCDRCFTLDRFHCRFFGTCMDKFGYIFRLINSVA